MGGVKNMKSVTEMTTCEFVEFYGGENVLYEKYIRQELLGKYQVAALTATAIQEFKNRILTPATLQSYMFSMLWVEIYELKAALGAHTHKVVG